MTKVIYTQQFTNNNSHTLEFDQCVSIHKDSRKSLSSSPLENDSFCRKKMKLIRRGSSKAVPPSDLSTTFTSSEPRLTVTENQQNTSVQSAVRRVRDTLVASDKRTILPLEMPFSRFESKGELHITKSILRELEVINQMDRKFILARARGVIYALDQHAVDERIRLEYLQQIVCGSNGQEVHTESLAVNIQVELTNDEYSSLLRFRNIFESFGWTYFLKEKRLFCTHPQRCPRNKILDTSDI
jgi:DNA mismatch repair ATPase MutL